MFRLCDCDYLMDKGKEIATVKITYETAEEMGNALLDAVALAEEHKEEVVITSTKANKLIALIGEEDCGSRFVVEPPVSKPNEPNLRVVA